MNIKYLIRTMVSVVLVSTLVIFIGCKKEASETEQNPETAFTNFHGFNVKVQNNDGQTNVKGSNWLSFETREDYELAIDVLSTSAGDKILPEFEKALSYKSMRVCLDENEREKIGIEDDVLATILNSSGNIQIGNYLFDIDVKNEIALVYDLTKDAEPMKFSTDDSFFDYIDGVENHASNSSKDEDILKSKDSWYSSAGYVDCKVVYQRAVVYFSLLSKISERTSIGTGGRVDLMLDVYPGSYTRNRSGAEEQTFGGTYFYYGQENSYSYRPYSKACGLKQLYMCADFGMIDYWTTNPTPKTMRLFIRKG